MPGVKMEAKQIILSGEFRFFKKRILINIIRLEEQSIGFPCKFRIRGPKENEPWFDVTINNRMYSLGWL